MARSTATRLDASLLYWSREPERLAWLLERLLPPTALKTLPRRGKGAAAPARDAARRVGRDAGLRKALIRLLEERLPPEDEAAALAVRVASAAAAPDRPGAADGASPDGKAAAAPPRGDAAAEDAAGRPPATEGPELPELTPDEWRRFLLALLARGDEAGFRSALDVAARLGESLGPAEDPPRTPSRPAARRTAERPPSRDRNAAADPTAALTREVEGLKREIGRLEEKLAAERERNRELAEERERLRAELREEQHRASALKQRLAAASDPAERERALTEELEALRHDHGVLLQKFELLEAERDDLRACLEDMERFQELVEEEVPSFRDRPLLDKERALAERLAARDGRPFRILVIGGAEPQLRHRDKFAEYAEVMGFEGEWRMAEYVSWQKGIEKLKRDMRERFDALVILHWNRTTFTKTARQICNDAGQKPCLTVHYEGFTDLRETLQEGLRQLLDTEAAAA